MVCTRNSLVIVLYNILFSVKEADVLFGIYADVTRVLCELDLSIQRVKVMPTPDGRVLDLFFITDGM